MKKLLQLTVRGRRCVIGHEGAVNDRGVRIPLRRVHAPDDACAWGDAVGRDNEAATRHAAGRRHVARCHLHALPSERRNSFRGEIDVVGLEVLVLPPHIDDPVARPLHVHGSSVNVMAFPGGCLFGEVPIAIDDRPVRIGRSRRREARGAVRRVG